MQPQEIQPLELQTFYGQGKTVEELAAQVAGIKRFFRISSAVCGAFIGLVIALTLIGLSTKRTRKTYEINNANCINCGRCFSYCPQNKKQLQ
jgi:NAD-dependent dihydropyrimidine dehydrogenase PreA subunit